MDTYPKSCWELCLAVAKYFQEKKKTTLRIALGPWGTSASFSGRCSLEELVLLKNNSQGQAASGNFALIFHLVTLHLSLISVIFEKHGLAKGRLRSVEGEFKACI